MEPLGTIGIGVIQIHLHVPQVGQICFMQMETQAGSIGLLEMVFQTPGIHHLLPSVLAGCVDVFMWWSIHTRLAKT